MHDGALDEGAQEVLPPLPQGTQEREAARNERLLGEAYDELITAKGHIATLQRENSLLRQEANTLRDMEVLARALETARSLLYGQGQENERLQRLLEG